MPQRTINIQWLNGNAQRRYPLAEFVNPVDQTNSFTIPDSFIVELDFPVHAGMDVTVTEFYIAGVSSYGNGYSVLLGYNAGSGPIQIATAWIPRATHVPNKAYTLSGVAPFDDSLGKILIGRLDDIDQQPGGAWTFAPAATFVDPDAIRPIVRGISSLTLLNGTESSPPMDGVIELQAGANFQLVPIIVSGQDPIIRFNAIQGEGLTDTCVCEGDAAPLTPIVEVNLIQPTPAGNFNLLGNDCITFTPITNGLKVSDVCCSPCCGCPELERLTQDLQTLQQNDATARDVLTRMEASVGAFQVLLSSKLADQGCIVC